ncbi:Major royal jelly protein 3 [Metarhizium anisopliae]|nr:Major royal jelly protein 3 [Metarhizium anisopliae]
MKVSSAFVLTLLTGALAAPSIVPDPDFEKRDVDAAAREFDDSAIADAVQARQVDTTVTLDQRDEDVEMVARAPGNAQGANAQGANKQGANKQGANKQGANKQGANKQGANKQGANKQGANKQGANKQGANKQGANKQGANKQDANKAGQNDASDAAEAAKPRVTSSFDAPGVVL